MAKICFYLLAFQAYIAVKAIFSKSTYCNELFLQQNEPKVHQRTIAVNAKETDVKIRCFAAENHLIHYRNG